MSRPDDATAPTRSLVVAAVATFGLTIDISKTSTLGFVIPGMRAEYGLSPQTASFLAVAGLSGTAVGAILFGSLADKVGRRTAYLLATLGFAVTSMCGSMPSFAGNLVMCAVMGLAVGGLAPLLVTVLADEFHGRRAHWVVGLSVVATAIGYLVAAGSALWLEPIFGWRILWLIGAPTGLVLVALTPLIPARARNRETRTGDADATASVVLVLSRNMQKLFAFLIGLLTFGLATWVPTVARSGGVSVTTANELLTITALVMVPCALVVAWGHRRIGPITLLTVLAGAAAGVMITLTTVGTIVTIGWLTAGVLAAVLFLVNTMAAVFLPIAATLSGYDTRGRATGRVSLVNRLGGLCGPLLLAQFISTNRGVLTATAVLAAATAAAAFWLSARKRRLVPVSAPGPGTREAADVQSA